MAVYNVWPFILQKEKEKVPFSSAFAHWAATSIAKTDERTNFMKHVWEMVMRIGIKLRTHTLISLYDTLSPILKKKKTESNTEQIF